MLRTHDVAPDLRSCWPRLHHVLASAGLVLSLAASPLAAQICPYQAPSATMQMISSPVTATEGAPVLFQALTIIPDCPPPPPGVPSTCGPMGYFIQSCDTLLWTFGDGTSETLHGGGNAMHTYAHTGLYDVKLHISNTLGSADLAGSIYVASSPATTITAPLDNDVSEAAQSVTIHVTRQGDLSRTNVVHWRLAANPNIMTDATGTLSFNPGETDKALTFPITSDHRYGGRYYSFLYLNLAADGAVAGGLGWDALHLQPTIQVFDDEAMPTGMLEDVTVSKGDDFVHVPVQLSGSFAYPCCRAFLDWRTSDGTAADGFDYVGQQYGSLLVQPDTTRVFIDIPLKRNSQPGTRTFDIELFYASLPLTRSHATITIEDNTPIVVSVSARLNVPVAGSAPLTISMRSPRSEPVQVELTSSDPAVATVSSTAVISPARSTTVLVQGIKPGHTMITVTPAGGQAKTVDVEVTPARRRAS
jgi:PKD repeat protein